MRLCSAFTHQLDTPFRLQPLFTFSLVVFRVCRGHRWALRPPTPREGSAVDETAQQSPLVAVAGRRLYADVCCVLQALSNLPSASRHFIWVTSCCNRNDDKSVNLSLYSVPPSCGSGGRSIRDKASSFSLGVLLLGDAGSDVTASSSGSLLPAPNRPVRNSMRRCWAVQSRLRCSDRLNNVRYFLLEKEMVVFSSSAELKRVFTVEFYRPSVSFLCVWPAQSKAGLICIYSKNQNLQFCVGPR